MGDLTWKVNNSDAHRPVIMCNSDDPIPIVPSCHFRVRYWAF